MKLFSPYSLLLFAALGSQAQTSSSSPDDTAAPTPPGLNFLFSCNVTMGLSIKVGTGVRNTTRAVFPISGGQAIGPKISAKVLEIGADWSSYGTFLNGTNVSDDSDASKNPDATPFYATDARFQLVTLDGANILVETKGQTAPDSVGGKAVHLRAQFDTASKAYRWLNDILSVGILRTNNDGYQIDLWQLTTPS